LLSKVFEKSLTIGRKNLGKSLDFFGLGDYEPCSTSRENSLELIELSDIEK
jgi:hypothetical protein